MNILCVLPDSRPTARIFSSFHVDWRWHRLLESLIGGLEGEVSATGGELFLMFGPGPGELEKFLDGRAVDGLITAVAAPENEEPRLTALYARQPVVGTLGGWVPDGAPYVGLDDLRAVGQLMDHLADEGFSSPAFFTSSWVPSASFRRRYGAFLAKVPGPARDRAVARSFLMPEDGDLRRLQQEKGLPAALDRWWEKVEGRVDSMLCFSDGMARAVLDWAGGRGIRVPEDLAVAGMDGAYLDGGRYAHLTTVRMDFHGLGRTCFRMLMERRKGSPKVQASRRLIPGDLVIGRSSLRKSLRLRDGENDFLAGARGYAAAHFADEDPTGDAAARAGLSRPHFRRKFGALAGEPFPSLIVRLRLEDAAGRLRSGNEPVTEIAVQVGFGNLGHFNKLFKARYGMNPRDYRGRNTR